MAHHNERLETVGSESKSDEIAIQRKLQDQNPDLRKSSGSHRRRLAFFFRGGGGGGAQ